MSEVGVKWLHAPGHAGSVGPEVVKFAVHEDPLVIDWSEMYWNVDDLRANGRGYQNFIGDPRRTDVRGRVVNHDVVLSVRSDAHIVDDGEFFIAHEIEQVIKYMPERWGKWVCFDIWGKRVLFIAWHPQPGALRRLQLVGANYKHSVSRVVSKQNELVRRFKPDLILNGGDLQLSRGLNSMCPNRVFGSRGMMTRNHKIDWQMWRGAGWRIVDFETLDASHVNSGIDHLWTQLKLATKA